MPLNEPENPQLDPVTLAVCDQFQRAGWQTEDQVVVALESANPAAVRSAIKRGLSAAIFTTWIAFNESRCGLMRWASEPENRKPYVP